MDECMCVGVVDVCGSWGKGGGGEGWTGEEGNGEGEKERDVGRK